jgi:exosome complex RNA-binding protein Rrp42 (RNase PH superfamily)
LIAPAISRSIKTSVGQQLTRAHIDPTPEEETCSSSGIIVSVTGNKKITAVRKIGSGSLHHESLSSMLKVQYLIEAVEIEEWITK